MVDTQELYGSQINVPSTCGATSTCECLETCVPIQDSNIDSCVKCMRLPCRFPNDSRL